MTSTNDFDRTLETWLRGQAPQQAPDRVLNAALERVEVAPQRRGWLQRIFGGTTMTVAIRTAAAATAVALAVLIGLQLTTPTVNVGPSPIPSPSAGPSEASPSPSAESAQPSPLSAAGLALQLWRGGAVGSFHVVTILDDGRVITSDPSGATAPMERRLTAAGIQLVRDEMDATGLTHTSADYQPVPNPGVENPGGGVGDLGQLEVGQPGGSTVVISWNLYNDTIADYFQPQPEAEALQALMLRLSTLEEWLPAAAWADPDPAAYLPDGYRITISSSAWGGSLDDLPPDVAAPSWPPEVDLADLNEVVSSPREGTRCRLVDTAEGAAVITALQAAAATPQDGTYLSFGLGDREAPRLITITLAPVLPFDETKVPRC